MKWKIKKCGWNKLKVFVFVFVFVVEGWLADLIIIRRLIVLLQIQMLWSFLQSPDLFFQPKTSFLHLNNKSLQKTKKKPFDLQTFPKRGRNGKLKLLVGGEICFLFVSNSWLQSRDHQGPPGLFSQRLLFVTAEVDKCVLYREWSWLWC